MTALVCDVCGGRIDPNDAYQQALDGTAVHVGCLDVIDYDEEEDER